MRRLLVTGGAGFIGANFVSYWSRKYPDDHIVVLDALTYAGNRANLVATEKNPQFQFVHGDIGDKELVQSLLLDGKLDTVVHFAAESHVDRSIHEPDAFIQPNVNGLHTFLKAAGEVGVGGLIEGDGDLQPDIDPLGLGGAAVGGSHDARSAAGAGDETPPGIRQARGP